MKLCLSFLCVPIILGFQLHVMAQTSYDLRSIHVAAPFLMLPPDARASALGGTGAATTPNVNSTYWNIAKIAFVPSEEKQYGIALNFTPLMAHIKGKVSNSYVSGIYQVGESKVITATFNYFTTGNVNLTDEYANTIGDFTPNEYALAIGYAQAFGPQWSMGIAFRYIHSNLLNVGTKFTGSQNNSGRGFASDFGIYYRNHPSQENQWSLGLMLSNIGTKLNFENIGENQSFFSPMNLRLGVQYSMVTDDKTTFRFSCDLNKLLVPTPPIRNNEGHIVKGKDNYKISTFQALYQSFYDAPNGGLEELKELQGGLGLEWLIDQKYTLRIGTTYQHPLKGQNRFMTAGLGYMLKTLGFDLGYLLSYDSNVNQTRNNTFVTSMEWRF